MAKTKRPLHTRITALVFAGTMGIFFTDPSSAQVGTTRGKLAKGDTEERSNKPVLANQAISAAGTKSKVARNIVAPVEVPDDHTSQAASPEKLNTVKQAAGGTEHVVVKGEMTKTGTSGNYVNKVDDVGPLGTKKLIDTPLSIMQVPEDVVQNEQVRSLDDTLKYLPSVQIESRGAGGVSRPQSRGFEGDNIENSRADGLNIVATAPYPSEMFSKVTVLNGIAGAIYGPQTPAGTFDYTLKRPTEKFFANFNMGADSGGAPMEHLDFGGRGFGKHAKWFGYRINLLNQQGESYTQGSHMRRDLVSGDFDIHLSKNTVLELDASQYSYAERGMPGMFSYDKPTKGEDPTKKNGHYMHHLPKAPDTHHAGYGQKVGGYNGSETMGQFKLKHKFNEKWKFKIGGMYENIDRDSFWVANTFTGHGDEYTQNVAQTTTVQGYHVWSNYAYLNGKFNTGSVFGQKITHNVNLGSNGYWLGNYNPQWADNQSIGTMSLSHPKVYNNIAQPKKGGNYESATTRQQAFMIGDTIDIGKHLSIMGEVSWAWIRTANYGKKGPSTSCGAGCTRTNVTSFGRQTLSKKDAAFAPMVAIMYKFDRHLSAYFTWGESWAPGPLAPAGTGNSGFVAPAQKSSEYEVGAKWAPNSKMLINVAAFSMERPYYYVQQDGNFGAGGKQHNYGVEAQISGKITKRLSVLAGMTWLDAQVRNPGYKAMNNKQVVGVAPLQANILLDYRVPYIEGLAFNANVHYTGRRAADVYNDAFVGSYTTLDLGARYATKLYGHDYILRFNVNNVTNESYWASVFPQSQDGAAGTQASVMAGMPRTWSVTASTFW